MEEVLGKMSNDRNKVMPRSWEAHREQGLVAKEGWLCARPVSYLWALALILLFLFYFILT